MANVGTLVAHLTLNTRTFERSLSGATKRMGGFAGGVAKIGLIGAGGLAALGLGAAKMAIDFESSFAGVRKTVDATEEEFAALSKGFRDMAKEIPVNVNELNRIGEAAGQLGIQTENILVFSRTMADLGATTNMSSDEAATALARLANITQMPQSQFERLGSTVVALGNNMATTEAEIVNMSLRLAASGAIVGLTEAEILSFAGALSAVGIRAESGGTAISRVMVDIANSVASGGEKLELFAATAGMSVDAFAKSFKEDAAGSIVTFIEGLGDITKAGGNVFPVLEALELDNVRVRNALLSAAGAGDTFREALALGSRAWEENTALADEAAKRYETTASQMKIFMNVIQDVAITIGTALLPTLTKLAQKGAEALKGVDFEGFAKSVGDGVGKIVDFIGNIPWGSILAGVGSVVGGIVDFIRGIPWGAIVEGLTTAAGNIIDFIKSLPWDDVLTGIAAVASGIVSLLGNLIKAIPWDSMLKGIESVAGFLKNNFIPILYGFAAAGVAAFIGMLPAIAAWATAAITGAVAMAIAMAPLTLTLLAVGVVVALVAKAWQSNWGNMRQLLVNVVGWIEKRIEAFVNFFIDKWNEIATYLNSFGKDIMPTVERKTFNAFRGMAESARDFGMDAEEMGKDVEENLGGVTRDLEGVAETAEKSLGEVTQDLEGVAETAAVAGIDIDALTRTFEGLGDESGDVADDMRDIENAINDILGMPLVGETAIDDALFNMGIEAKKLEAQLIRMGGRGAEGTEPIEEALKSLRAEMRLTRLEAEIEFAPLARVIERVAIPIHELSVQEKLDKILELRPMTMADIASIAENFGLVAEDVVGIGDFNFQDMTATKTDMLSIADSTGKILANLEGIGRQVGFGVGPRGAVPTFELPPAQVEGLNQIPTGDTQNIENTQNITINGADDPSKQADKFASDPRIIAGRTPRGAF